MAAVTLDSGALIGFERWERRVVAHLKEALQRGSDLTVPTVVVAEVWRGGARSARIASLLEACVVEPLFEPLARTAGEALAAVSGAGMVDAVVVASAASRGDRILTSDYDDLDRLRAHFRGVRLVRI